MLSIYVLLYIGMSLPIVQERIKNIAEEELSKALQTHVGIGKMTIRPFNTLILNRVSIPTPAGEEALYVEKIAAGIDLMTMLFEHRIRINFGEIIGLNAHIRQSEPDGDYNIQFLVDALKPKEEGKPPTQFDITLSAIVIRKSAIRFDRQWMPADTISGRIDFNHIHLTDFRADITIPRLSNNHYDVDLRRLAFRERSGFTVDALTLKADVTPERIQLKNFSLSLPESQLKIADISLPISGFDAIPAALNKEKLNVKISDSYFAASDFVAFFPALRELPAVASLALEAEGNLRGVEVKHLKIDERHGMFSLEAIASSKDILSVRTMTARLDELRMQTDLRRILPFAEALGVKGAVKDYMNRIATLGLQMNGEYAEDMSKADLAITTSSGSLEIQGEVKNLFDESPCIKANAASIGIDIGALTGISALGRAQFSLTADVMMPFNSKKGRQLVNSMQGKTELAMPLFEYQGHDFSNTSITLEKFGEDFSLSLNSANENALLAIDADATAQTLQAAVDIEHFNLSALGIRQIEEFQNVAIHINADLEGSNLNDLAGTVYIKDATLSTQDKDYLIGDINVASLHDAGDDVLSIESDYVSASLRGNYALTKIPEIGKSIISEIAPGWLPQGFVRSENDEATTPLQADLKILVKAHSRLPEYVKLPVTLLEDLLITGRIDSERQEIAVSSTVPWLQQGRNKLITNTALSLNLNGAAKTANLRLQTTMPAKHGMMNLCLNTNVANDDIGLGLAWNLAGNDKYRGEVGLKAFTEEYIAGPDDNLRHAYSLEIAPSVFVVNDTTWHISGGRIDYRENLLSVSGLEAGQDNQYVSIRGQASQNPEDIMRISLHNIDLDWLFETLAINYVTFGGRATGDVYAMDVFSKEPRAFTDNLYVEGLKYNGAELGNGRLRSRFDMEQLAVYIGADIRDRMNPAHSTALVDGGIWIGRDSLSFDIEARRANAAFMRPFFAAFASDLEGLVSGKIKLYGTFSDVNLVGRAFADTVSLRVNYTNVTYTGSDSVIMTPGRIVVPGFKVYDRDGNSGVLSGVVTHNYFHDPAFEFQIKDCHNLLCFDTNSAMNPIWYGTIYGTGGGSISGWPGYVGIAVDMQNSLLKKSTFTFVLTDTEEAKEYKFLTFTDRRAEAARALEQKKDTVPDFIKAFNRQATTADAEESAFALELRGTVNPMAELTIVMDPIAGDKITGTGEGYMQVGYNSVGDVFTMNGTYTIGEGNYNFSLQDIILKNFNILPGSKITFDGDPFDATLDIDAAYRVNTNLTDLDDSFATDKDLNRTNVPVEAILKVDGRMLAPDITFDIKLPTLTSDVERKVKSIISTEDMMSRQIIYLLALGRFYTPEYMGVSSNGAEWASVASSTLSSQIANIVDNLSENWSFAPSFHSDKGNFSDIEFDLALSSGLLNNRLLLNGNFGYRDRSTSSTAFIGDFDIEYLLNASGNLRLKAYNRYNDQNYYLKSALTTQGIGIVFKRDFNSWRNILRSAPPRGQAESVVPARETPVPPKPEENEAE